MHIIDRVNQILWILQELYKENLYKQKMLAFFFYHSLNIQCPMTVSVSYISLYFKYFEKNISKNCSFFAGGQERAESWNAKYVCVNRFILPTPAKKIQNNSNSKLISIENGK